MPSDELADTPYQQATIATANDLRTIATRLEMQQLSRLSLPEIEYLSNEVARVVPAGNIPGIILSGLSRVGGREVKREESRRHIGMLFKGARQALDKAIYGAFFAGPAAVLYGYQQIVKLSGRSPDAAFPNGTWQFYLEFALRDDGARHANETTGFHMALDHYGLRLSDGDALAAWLLATVNILYTLPAMLANEWDERMIPSIMAAVAEEFNLPDAGKYQAMVSQWLRELPYQRGDDAGSDDYPTYRRRKFGEFLQPYYDALPPEARTIYHDRLEQVRDEKLGAYIEQMSWLAYLEPGPYHEERIPYDFDSAYIGVIWQGRYYLLPAQHLLDPDHARAWAATILQSQPTQPPATLDDDLVTARRSAHPQIRKQLDKNAAKELESLRRTPVILNWDQRDANQPLALIRRGKRGIGDHALTIFRTQESIVLDQSHIFFDGGWGSAIAEILTGEAISWAVYLAQLSPAKLARKLPYSPPLQSFPALTSKAAEAQVPAETGAENIDINLRRTLGLRKLLKQRSDLVKLTVNDLLVLYRSLHTHRYRPSPTLQERLNDLRSDHRSDARQAYEMIMAELERLQSRNPAVLIPIDASRFDPRERLFPTTFRNPLADLYEQHVHTLETLNAYRSAASGARGPEFKAFNKAQLQYLRLLAGFGELLSRYREIAVSGESTSTASIKFLGNMPDAMKKLLDTIPSRFDVLNEVIKGEEVFSNMGRVAAGSTLRRFITAKDDNEQKTLAWGVITDDQNILHLSLRDFRPHVAVLHKLGLRDLAQQITQDYIDTYAEGFNNYIYELREITVASRETRIESME